MQHCDENYWHLSGWGHFTPELPLPIAAIGLLF
jgi:hypothetical protein